MKDLFNLGILTVFLIGCWRTGVLAAYATRWAFRKFYKWWWEE